jgi:2-phospho-L-lactate/phosphoenolpyruvate guanylyltransferase
MGTTIIVPVKRLREGKSRLAEVLDASHRIALCQRLVTRTLSVACAVAPVVVVTADPWVRDAAAAAGAAVVAEAALAGLNAALDTARANWPANEQLLVLPVDLPRLTPETLRDLTGSSDDVVIAPDRHGRGTNILVLPAAAALSFRFAFGPDSCRRHADEAARLGLRARRLQRADAAFDLDTPADLAEDASVAF